MYADLRGRADFLGQASADGIAALRHAQSLGHERPLLLGYYPVARINPFQALLYGDVWEAGVAPVPLMRLTELPELLALQRHGASVALHLHWSSNITAPAQSAVEASGLVAEFLESLDEFLDGGGRFAWTVHNRLPHEARFIDAELALRRGLADRAQLIHVLTASTGELMADIAELPPERVLHIPHPSYAGGYPDTSSRADARWELGVQPGELALGFLGSIQPYKGLDRLLTAFAELRESDPATPRRLLVAGQPSGDVTAALRTAALDPDVVLQPTRISMNDVQRWMHATDVLVLPYLEALNSGVLVLALTFGVPVIAPDLPTVRELVDDTCAVLFDPTDDRALLAALRRAPRLANDAARAGARAAVAELDPHRLSRAFGRAVRDRLR